MGVGGLAGCRQRWLLLLLASGYDLLNGGRCRRRRRCCCCCCCCCYRRSRGTRQAYAAPSAPSTSRCWPQAHSLPSSSSSFSSGACQALPVGRWLVWIWTRTLRCSR